MLKRDQTVHRFRLALQHHSEDELLIFMVKILLRKGSTQRFIATDHRLPKDYARCKVSHRVASIFQRGRGCRMVPLATIEPVFWLTTAANGNCSCNEDITGVRSIGRVTRR